MLLSFLIIDSEGGVRHAHRKLVLTSQISTADVDPDFVQNYQAETVDFPDSPRYYHQSSSSTNAHYPHHQSHSFESEILTEPSNKTMDHLSNSGPSTSHRGKISVLTKIHGTLSIS